MYSLASNAFPLRATCQASIFVCRSSRLASSALLRREVDQDFFETIPEGLRRKTRAGQSFLLDEIVQRLGDIDRAVANIAIHNMTHFSQNDLEGMFAETASGFAGKIGGPAPAAKCSHSTKTRS